MSRDFGPKPSTLAPNSMRKGGCLEVLDAKPRTLAQFLGLGQVNYKVLGVGYRILELTSHKLHGFGTEEASITSFGLLVQGSEGWDP